MAGAMRVCPSLVPDYVSASQKCSEPILHRVLREWKVVYHSARFMSVRDLSLVSVVILGTYTVRALVAAL